MQGNAGKRQESDFDHRPSCPRGASTLPYLPGNTASTTASPDDNSTTANRLCQTSFEMSPFRDVFLGVALILFPSQHHDFFPHTVKSTNRVRKRRNFAKLFALCEF